jgi:hypothetical protein
MFNFRSVSSIPSPLLISILLIASFAIILFSSHEPYWYDDGLRHIVIAQQFLASGLHTWHQYFFAGYFSTRDLNPWFLSDLAYVPLAWLDTVTALKLTTICQISLLVGAFYLLLRQLHVVPQLQAIFIAVLLLGSEYFTLRLLLGRPFVLSAAVFFFALWAILQRRYLVLAGLIAISVLLSHMFVFTLVLCFVSALWCIWCEQGSFRSALRILSSWLGGASLGFLLHPQQQLYMSYIREVFVVIPFSKDLGIGWEFSSGLLHAEPSVFLILGLLPVLIVLAGRQLGQRYLVLHRASFILLLALSLVFFGGYLIWQRTIDYLWPLLLLTTASIASCSPQFQSMVMQALWQKRIWKLSLLHILVFVGFWQLAGLWLGMRYPSEKPSIVEFDVLQRLPPQARVFNLDWDYFPAYFFFRPDLQYARGMDPTLDYKHNALDFQAIDIVRQGEESITTDAQEWLAEVTKRFNPQYLVIDKLRYPALTSQLAKLASLRVAGKTDKIIAFQIHPSNPANK